MKLLLIGSGQKMGEKILSVLKRRGNGEKVQIAQSITQAKSDYELESFDGVIMDVSSPDITKEELENLPKYSFNVAVTEADYENHPLVEGFHDVMAEPLEEEVILQKLHKIETARHFFMEM